MESSSAATDSLLESIFNHVALPPQLPGTQEKRTEAVERALTEHLLEASRIVRDLPKNSFSNEWDCMYRLLQTCKVVNAGSKLDKTSLLTEFQRLECSDLLMLHVTEQNAGILIRRDHDMQGDSVIFEVFEVSAVSERVLASGNALQWDFPVSTVAIPFSQFNESTFQDNLAEFLEQASTESIKSFAARTQKAESYAIETRDTVDPCLITQMLMTLLEANGSRVFPPLLRKRVRDDVCWTDGAQKPWRRCPFWLLLRVGVQRHFCTLLGGETGRVHYKFLICLVLARLLNESLDHLSPELLAFLKAKICRRLVKLEVDKDRSPPNVRAIYEYLFTNLEPLFHKIIQDAIERVKVTWTNFKNIIRRTIPSLPLTADPRDLYLTLPNSGFYLQQVLREPLYQHKESRSSAPYRLSEDYDVSVPTTKHLRAFVSRYYSLSEIEAEPSVAVPASMSVCEVRCKELASKIDEYLNSVAGVYDSNPEQKSIMLLTVVELWVSLDECATKLFGLLEDYSPGFPPEILDVLQLPLFRDMCRLQKIQEYLQRRHEMCTRSGMTIFHDLTKGCFAERYFAESQDSMRLQKLRELIETAADAAREKKEQEWQKSSTVYEDYVKEISTTTCRYTTDGRQSQTRLHDDRRCRKCFLQRKSKRMKIKVHEHPLPSDPVQAKAVVFELGCPQALAAYRDATWRILGTLAYSKLTGYRDPQMLLCNYSGLKAHRNSTTQTLSLASTTKSFLNSHYSTVSFPVSLDHVCYPNRLKFAYFDTLTNSWPAQQTQKPSFARHCHMIISKSSPFSSLQSPIISAMDTDGPSSSEIIASQTVCPSSLNFHEFGAFQGLFAGKFRRWPQILRELGESNLNFSTEATILLISQLALQVGPAHQADPLRIVHRFFRDESFCKRLLEQLDQRLDGIASNWREFNCMEMLVTLTLRLISASPLPTVVVEAFKLLEKARAITFKWIVVLRIEIRRATDADVSRRCSSYVFWAALLCRRTFAVHVDNERNIQPSALCCFIECSITLQENLFSDPATLPLLSRNAFIRDLKMVYRMRYVLRKSLEVSPGSMTAAINAKWPEPEEGQSRSLSGLSHLSYPNEWWIQSTIESTQQSMEQTLHYHLLEGHLLVDGQPLGKMPADHRRNLEQLFPGNQSLLTYPSGLPGMTYMLAICMYGHQIHVGFRKEQLIVRACVHNTVLELIPPEVFVGPLNFDLPALLVEGCAHWLDLNTGVMEIRQQSNAWKSIQSNWVLDFNTRLAKRRRVTLIDPQSSLFQRVAHIFDQFEYCRYLTVFQPSRGNLSVELRRLELSFTVNRKNLLQSSQLRSEIDPNQDAGTWYGLNSKLVLRDFINPRQRSILTPIGDLTCTQNLFHVTIEVENNGNYGRFTINDVLGRLDCPAEPLLLYLKARYHAYTSFVIPDPLTDRTGTEEALHCLKSGFCSPWTGLNLSPHKVLLDIARLTPRRDYYPTDLKVMQQVFWDARLTTTIQHDGFRPIVEAICGKSDQLSAFAFQKTEPPLLESAGDSHLLYRSYARRRLLQRPDPHPDGKQALPDLPYNLRDCRQSSKRNRNVFEIVSTICTWTSKMPTTLDLAGILERWPIIGGCDRLFDKPLLSDRLGVDFALEWGPLINLCRDSEPKDKYRLMFLFALLSFRDDVEMEILLTLITYSILDDLKAIDPPEWSSYIEFRQSEIPDIKYLLPLIKPYCVPYPGDERSTLQSRLSSKQIKKFEAAELAHEQQTEIDSQRLAEFLIDQWPCFEPTIQGFSRPALVDVTEALEIINAKWQVLFRNLELSRYIEQVQLILDSHRAEGTVEAPNTGVEDLEVLPTRCRGGELPGLSQNLLRKTDPILSKGISSIFLNGRSTQITGQLLDDTLCTVPAENLSQSPQKPIPTKPTTPFLSREIQELEDITNGIAESRSTVRKQYQQDMMQSLNKLKVLKTISKQERVPIQPATLSNKILEARRAAREQFSRIREVFERNDPRVKWLQKGDLWPCITPVTLLEQLRSTSASTFGDHLKENLILYACSITTLQRLMRMEDANLKNNVQRLLEEQENIGHENWQPLENPDWLLLEIDANILIRHDQVDVALATISPASGSNSVLQMNMGQGKTSCIIPMVAAVLADTKKLLRVIVPKPLLLQTAQLLHSRLGGLLGRKIRHVPFSRKTSTKSYMIEAFQNIHNEILQTSGVMLTLPEHILSFKLSGLQRLSDIYISEASQMIQIQSWMSSVSRDVIDECDFTLAVRTQLIYPSGSQMTVDGHPHRWETAEALLRLVESHLWNLRCDFPKSIEVVRRPGAFPVIFFLRKDAEDAILARLVEDICSGRTSILLTRECKKSDRLAIKQFISDAKVEQQIVARIRQIFPDKPAMKQNIYLLRGLIVHRILLLALKKRWNVQYGLNPDRDPIAVPFHAKGVPSEQAEWGHPDVAILFTCLSFYYLGLDVSQLRQSIEHILKSDDPSSEYDRWTHSSTSLPGSLREWNAINVDDEAQLIGIWQHMRHNMIVINYFLNNFVFPKHAKQFLMKLQASGWDIPLLPGNLTSTSPGVGKYPQTLTTGFSGTNDTKMLLPLTVKQADLPGLSHINAEVLTSLLQTRSRQYVHAADYRGRHWTELDLLRDLSEREIRVLIDVGAQILEMDNLSLAKTWLRICYQAPAAVYFDSENKPSVLYRNGHRIPLLASPFAENLGDCLVYLDEAHTRGTDLKMPANAIGALTLGLNLQKDTVVQAAMRLRQLATSQSVVFFAPPEVHQCILDLRKKNPGDKIDSYDVICWLLEQTCDSIEQLQPLYFSQGADFCCRTQAALDNPNFLASADQRNAYLGVLQQKETQTLKKLYEPKINPKSIIKDRFLSPQIAAFMKELNALREGFQDTGDAVHVSALQEVEQEREISFEVEAVREVQKPVHYSPLTFLGLHKDILRFVKTGRLVAGSVGYEQASVTLGRTALGLKYGISSQNTTSKLYVSTEFCQTVSLPKGRANDNFIRQVDWVLWSFVSESALIITPEEAEFILPIISKIKMPVTHLLTYAAPVTRKMLHFNALKYYAVPSLPIAWEAPTWLRIELGIFAGRLYFGYEEYSNLREHLGLSEAATKLSESMDDSVTMAELNRTGERVEDTDDGVDTATIGQKLQSINKKPLTFLQDWLTVRRKGQDFMNTPMGYVCQGKPLTESHPFFLKLGSDGTTNAKPANMKNDEESGGNVGGLDDGGDSIYDGDGFDVDDDDGYNSREDENRTLDEDKLSGGEDHV